MSTMFSWTTPTRRDNSRGRRRPNVARANRMRSAGGRPRKMARCSTGCISTARCSAGRRRAHRPDKAQGAAAGKRSAATGVARAAGIHRARRGDGWAHALSDGLGRSVRAVVLWALALRARGTGGAGRSARRSWRNLWKRRGCWRTSGWRMPCNTGAPSPFRGSFRRAHLAARAAAAFPAQGGARADRRRALG